MFFSMTQFKDVGECESFGCSWQGPNSRAPSSGQARERAFGVRRPSDGGVGSHKAWASGGGGPSSTFGSTGDHEDVGQGVLGFPQHPSPLTPSPHVSMLPHGLTISGSGNEASGRSVGSTLDLDDGTVGGGGAGVISFDRTGERKHRASPPPPQPLLVSSGPAVGFGIPGGAGVAKKGSPGEESTGVRSLRAKSAGWSSQSDNWDPQSPPPKPPDQLVRPGGRQGDGGAGASAGTEADAGAGGSSAFFAAGSGKGEEVPAELPTLGLTRPSGTARYVGDDVDGLEDGHDCVCVLLRRHCWSRCVCFRENESRVSGA